MTVPILDLPNSNPAHSLSRSNFICGNSSSYLPNNPHTFFSFSLYIWHHQQGCDSAILKAPRRLTDIDTEQIRSRIEKNIYSETYVRNMGKKIEAAMVIIGWVIIVFAVVALIRFMIVSGVF